SVLDSGMRIVSPTDLVPTWKKKSILLYSKGSAASVAARESSRYKSAAYKQAKKVQRAAVRSGPEFREFNRIDVAVRRAEQAGKDTSALIEQRERARAAWKAAKQPSK
ncbi:hypothetical protein P0E82_13655, partial [Enterococcus faecalis]|uniref:hypothetical protein n=1 Tax=Enterococcus faecalis TaxID=1351 RepID=UPI0025B265B9